MFAQDNLQLTVKPKVGNTFGEIQCLLKKDYYPHVDYGLKYQRLYSLNTYMVGFEISLTKDSEDFPDWVTDLNLNRNVDNPDDDMVNSEWFSDIFPYYQAHWNHEAKYYSEIKHFIVNFKGKKRLTRPHRICLYLWSGLRYQRLEQDLFVTSESINEPSIYYNYIATSPFLGLIFNFTPNSRTTVDFSAAYMLSFVSEYYNHYDFSQYTEFEGRGHGLITSVKMKAQLRNNFLYVISSTGIESEFIYSRTSTELDLIRYWPSLRTLIDNIDNVTTITQFSLYLNIGIDL